MNKSATENDVYDEPTLSVQSEEQLLVDGVPVITASIANNINGAAGEEAESTADDEVPASIPQSPQSPPRSLRYRESSISSVANTGANGSALKLSVPQSVNSTVVRMQFAPVTNVERDDDVCTLSPNDDGKAKDQEDKSSSKERKPGHAKVLHAIRVEHLLDRWHVADQSGSPQTRSTAANTKPNVLVEATPPDSPLEKTLDVNTPVVPKRLSPAIAPVAVERSGGGPLAPATPSDETVDVPDDLVNDDDVDIENAPTLAPASMSDDDGGVVVPSSGEVERKRALAAAVEAAALDDAPIAPPLRRVTSSPTYTEPPLSNWSVHATVGDTQFSPVDLQHPTQDEIFIKTDDAPPLSPRRSPPSLVTHSLPRETQLSSQLDAHALTASDLGSVDEHFVRHIVVPKRRFTEAAALDGAAMSCDDGEPLTQQPPSSPSQHSSAAAAGERAKRPRVAPTAALEA
jgi:hypothetical protein